MSLHRCTDTACPYLGQTSTKGCACHESDEQVLRASNAELVAALERADRALENVGMMKRAQARQEIAAAIAKAGAA